LGRARALALARAGANVAVLDREADRAKRVAGEVSALGRASRPVIADATHRDAVPGALAEAWELGALDVVVNIVGSASWAKLLEMDDATWERDLLVNLTQHWYVGRAAVRKWIEAGRPGSLVVVGSISGLFAAPSHAAYGAAKAGLLAFVRSASEEWWPHKIRVNAVVPGSVRTPRIEAEWARGNTPQAGSDLAERMSLPEDIAHAAVFLASGLARTITGQTLVVDGGATTRFPYRF
jgi:3-oxoacyl-[acyl-carrier protein] reductase